MKKKRHEMLISGWTDELHNELDRLSPQTIRGQAGRDNHVIRIWNKERHTQEK